MSGIQRPSSNFGRRADLDMLLNDWNVHHLHIGRNRDESGFIERGNDLIFGIFHENKAFLIGAYVHGDWAKKEIAEIIQNEWPQIGNFVALNSVLPGNEPESAIA